MTGAGGVFGDSFAGGCSRGAGGDRMVRGAPRGKVSVQQADVIGVAERGEQAVHPADRHRVVAVEHDVRVVTGARRGEDPRERGRVGGPVPVAQRGHVIEHAGGARDVSAGERVGVAGGVDDDHRRIVEVGLQPLHRDDRRRAGGRRGRGRRGGKREDQRGGSKHAWRLLSIRYKRVLSIVNRSGTARGAPRRAPRRPPG